MAQFSDTSNYTGLVQIWEFWTRNPSGQTSSTLLKQVTQRINAAFEHILPILLAYNDQIRWDDLNNTDAPSGKINLVSGQNAYKITTDDNSYDILNITHVRILRSSSDTQYWDLERIKADDPCVTEVLSPSSGITGIPTGFLERGNVIYLDLPPDYSATNGIQIFFGRQQQYFVSTDTTKEPGIPLPFHELLALFAALDWNMVNRTEDVALITRLQQRIEEKKRDLKNFTDMRHPTNVKMTMKRIWHR